tara:strand:- start:1681 stop:1920 length:240 start_codon:yes stop_codon:yes gene_type:complete
MEQTGQRQRFFLQIIIGLLQMNYANVLDPATFGEGFVHGDFKPGNVFVSESTEAGAGTTSKSAMLGDFGATAPCSAFLG